MYEFYRIAPLYRAVVDKNFQHVKLFLENGAEVDALNYYDCEFETALHLACRQKLIQEAKLSLEYDAQVNAKNSIGQTPLL